MKKKNECDLQVRIFHRNVSFSTMLLSTAKEDREFIIFLMWPHKKFFDNVQISSRIYLFISVVYEARYESDASWNSLHLQ